MAKISKDFPLCDKFYKRLDKLPSKATVEAPAEVPVRYGAEYLLQRFIIERIDGDDVQVSSEATWRFRFQQLDQNMPFFSGAL